MALQEYILRLTFEYIIGPFVWSRYYIFLVVFIVTQCFTAGRIANAIWTSCECIGILLGRLYQCISHLCEVLDAKNKLRRFCTVAFQVLLWCLIAALTLLAKSLYFLFTAPDRILPRCLVEYEVEVEDSHHHLRDSATVAGAATDEALPPMDQQGAAGMDTPRSQSDAINESAPTSTRCKAIRANGIQCSKFTKHMQTLPNGQITGFCHIHQQHSASPRA